MSVSIISGGGSNVLTVDATSLAARSTLYDSSGNELFPKPSTGSYMAAWESRATAANAAGTTLFAMRNVSSASPTAYIRRIRGTLSFDGTASAANGLRIGFYRFTTATPTGGTAITIIKKDTSYGSPAAITDARFASGTTLTMTSTVLDASPFAVFSISASVTNGVVPFNIDFQQENSVSPFRLKSGEGICCNHETVAAIVGMTTCGYVEWDERA